MTHAACVVCLLLLLVPAARSQAVSRDAVKDTKQHRLGMRVIVRGRLQPTYLAEERAVVLPLDSKQDYLDGVMAVWQPPTVSLLLVAQCTEVWTLWLGRALLDGSAQGQCWLVPPGWAAAAPAELGTTHCTLPGWQAACQPAVHATSTVANHYPSKKCYPSDKASLLCLSTGDARCHIPQMWGIPASLGKVPLPPAHVQGAQPVYSYPADQPPGLAEFPKQQLLAAQRTACLRCGVRLSARWSQQ